MRSKFVLVVFFALGAAALTFSPAAQGQRGARLNKLVDVLSQNKVTFGISAGGGADAAALRESGKARAANKDVDFVFMSMAEPRTFNIANLKAYMQGLIEGGATRNPSSHSMLLRVPTFHENAELGKTRIAQALDAGVHILMLPHVESAGEADAAIGAMRYPQPAGARDAQPVGTRSNSTGDAPAYWGISQQEYRQKADLWPLDPNGELAVVVLLESVEAVEKNRRAITGVKGVTVAIPAPGDLRSAYTQLMFPEIAAARGARGAGRGAGPQLSQQQQDTLQAKLEEAFAMELATCKELNVVCGITAGAQDIEKRVKQGFRFIIANDAEALRIGRAAAGR